MELIINNNLFNVKCMITKKDTEMGMMGKTFDNSFDGMLFMMGDGDHSFWMKNCIIPLDIIFIKNKLFWITIINVFNICSNVVQAYCLT